MPCNKCGAGVGPVDVPEPTDEGSFTEEYECDNGHKGFVSGREEQPPSKWDKYGAVYGG